MEYNLKYDELVREALEDKPLPEFATIANEKIVEIALAIRRNFTEIQALLAFPHILTFFVEEYVRADVETTHELFGQWDVPNNLTDTQKRTYKSTLSFKRYRRDFVPFEKLKPHYLLDRTNVFLGPDGEEALHEGLRYILVSALLNAWTAFEVLSSDLWVVALNHGPKELAQKACKAPPPGVTPKKGSQQKSFNFSLLTDYGFDLTNKLGTILRDEGKYSFMSLETTIDAYEEVFGEDITDQFFSKASRDCGDVAVLEALRNLFAHKAGKIDSMFISSIKQASGSIYANFADLPGSTNFKIDAVIVRDLVLSASKLSEALLEYVDKRM